MFSAPGNNLKLAPNGGQVGPATTVVGTSNGYDDDPDGSDVVDTGNTACSSLFRYILAPGATPECTATGAGTLTITPGLRSEDGYTIVSARFVVDATAGCTLAAPAINADITVEIRQKCQNGSLTAPEFRVLGEHDGFPWYELWIEDVPGYLFSPCTYGQWPESLFPPMEWDIGEDVCPECPTWRPLYP